jgi:hypothetical protein
MRRWVKYTLLIALAGAGPLCLCPATGGDLPPVLGYAEGKLISGAWTYDFAASGGVQIDIGRRITGLAFGPGRSELAYCTAASEGGDPSALWTLAVSGDVVRERGLKDLRARPRLLWKAPEGRGLRGPVRWAPDGSRIAILECQDDRCDLLVVDYVGGGVARMTDGEWVRDMAWSPQGEYVARIIGPDDAHDRAVWVQTFPPMQGWGPLGDGAYDLRWSLDGKVLRWLSRGPEGRWSDVAWRLPVSTAVEVGHRPARAGEASWSPDGRTCAVLESGEDGGCKQLVLYAARSSVGERLDLPHIGPRRLLGWSPDSGVVVVLGDTDIAFAVAVHQPPDLMHTLTGQRRDDSRTPRWIGGGQEYSTRRAAMLTLPLDPGAGPPAWSTGGDMVAYVVAARLDPRHPLAEDRGLSGMAGTLVVSPVGRAFEGRDQVVKQKLLDNMKRISLGLQMYLADHDDRLPLAEDVYALQTVLRAYVKSDDVYMLPGDGEIIVEYVGEPGQWLGDMDDPVSTPVAVVDCYRDFSIVAYADGRATILER